MRRTGRNLMQQWVLYRRVFRWRGLVRFRYLRDQILIHFQAPESLTGCGPEQPKGLFTCTSALIMEVRPAIIVEFRS